MSRQKRRQERRRRERHGQLKQLRRDKAASVPQVSEAQYRAALAGGDRTTCGRHLRRILSGMG